MSECVCVCVSEGDGGEHQLFAMEYSCPLKTAIEDKNERGRLHFIMLISLFARRQVSLWILPLPCSFT